MLDLTYNPVSPFSISKHTEFPSMTSVFDKLGAITATETQADDTDTDSKSENIVPDPTNEPTDTFLHKNSTSTTMVSPKSNNNFSNRGYYDSNIPQSTDVVSMDKVMQTGSSISPPSYPSEDSEKCNLVLEDYDQNNIYSEADIRNDDDSEAEMSFIGSDHSDTCVGSRTSVVELFGVGDHNGTATHASVVQSNGYVHSENLLANKDGSRHGSRHGSLDLNSHIIESVSLHSISLEEAADPQSIPTLVESPKNEGYYEQTKEMSSTSGYLSATVVSDTHAANCILAVKPFSGDHNDTAACNSAWKSSEYVHSENLRAGNQGSLCAFNLNSHIVESESLHSITLEEAADSQSTPTMAETSKNEGDHVPTKQLPSTSGYISDSTDATNYTSLVEPFSRGHNNTAAYNSAGQSSEYVWSENLLANSHEPLSTFDLNSHIESESLHLISLVEAVDPPTLAESPKNEGYYVQTKELPSLSGYLSNTVVSDTHAANCNSTIVTDHNDTAPCNSARQSNGYVHSEYMLTDSSHIVESESLHSIPLEEALELPSSSGDLSDNGFATNSYSTSIVEPSTGDCQDKAACNSAGKSSECIHGEELVEVSYGSLDFNHIDKLESEFLPSMCLEEAAGPQLITFMMEEKEYYTPAKKSRLSPGYLPNTHLLSSV